MHAPQVCDGCGGSLATAQTGDVSVRQVFDLPVIELEVIEHQVQAKQCACGHITRARFPAEATAPACYGPRLQALGVYLLNHQHLPVARAAELMSQVLCAHVSTGWVGSLQHRAAQVLEEDFTGDLDDRLRESAVAHFDETGARVAGRLGWVHTAVTESLTS